jgi:hypothetical protein
MGSGYEIARAVEKLIRLGHPPERAWRYTPRQLNGWLQLAERRRHGELAQLAAIVRLAQSSDNVAVKKELQKLQDESQ